jgi:hypothetical protein
MLFQGDLISGAYVGAGRHFNICLNRKYPLLRPALSRMHNQQD